MPMVTIRVGWMRTMASSNRSPNALPPRWDHRRRSAESDHAWLPWREHVVDHYGRPAGALHVPELLGLAHPQATHLDRIVVGVVAKRRRHHVRLPVRPDRGYPAQALPSEIFEFLVGDDAHAALN